MRLQRTSLLAAAIAGLLLSPITTLACACCSNNGDYFSGAVDLEDYRLSELKRMRFARTASLIVSEAGLEEDARGMDEPQLRYQLYGAFIGNTWRLVFRSGVYNGILELPLPGQMWSHAADIHDGKLGAGGGPLLYKEWRLEGEVKGNGFFKNGTSEPAKYTLVLQGRGNGCDNAEDFGNWRLQVNGEKARYAFYGKLARPMLRKD